MLALFILAAACRKNSDTSSSSLSFDLDGTHYDFDSIATNVDTSAGPVIIGITALNTKTRSSVSVATQANVPTAVGTYHHSDDTTRILIYFVINIIKDSVLAQYAVQGPNAFDFSITSFGSGRMGGNFSGKIPVLTSSASPASVANGKFSTPY